MRKMFLTKSESDQIGQIEEMARKERNGRNVLVYLQASRIHKELLERYNPTLRLSEEEKIKLTANRVGLDMPKTVGSE